MFWSMFCEKRQTDRPKAKRFYVYKSLTDWLWNALTQHHFDVYDQRFYKENCNSKHTSSPNEVTQTIYAAMDLMVQERGFIYSEKQLNNLSKLNLRCHISCWCFLGLASAVYRVNFKTDSQ